MTLPGEHAPVTAAPGPDLAKRAMYLRTNFHLFGNSRKVKSSAIAVRKNPFGASPEPGSVEIDTDVKMNRLHTSKRLLESPELAAVGTLDGQVKKYLGQVCLPFDPGINLVPFVAVPTVDARLTEFAVERNALVEEFIKAYPTRCEEAAKDLNTQYSPLDYPTVDEMRRRFGFSWRFVSFGVPEQLKEISQQVWEQERDKAQLRMAEASGEIQQMLREAMAGLVEHMSNRLRDGADGKPVMFHKNAIANLTSFLESFEFRNITDDVELQKVVAQARELLKGVRPDQLKKAGDIRVRVQGGIEQLKAQLDALVVNAGSRRFDLDEE
jgi:hypothetical protein